jgi:2-C-methyl-D-erythritol 4-phosphate cytidylyltransferase
VSVGVVVVAAGRGERLGAQGPKALVPLAGRTLLAHTLERLREAGLPPAVVVHTPGEGPAFAAAAEGVPVAGFVPGGATRTASVRAGLDALEALDAELTVVAVHDAARPLTPADVIRRAVAAVEDDVVAAAPAVAVADTLKRVAGPLSGRSATEVVATVDRDRLVGVQTPQVFPRTVLVRALRAGTDATDDLALVEGLLAEGTLAGRVVVVAGSLRGIKITYPEDLQAAAALLRVAERAPVGTREGTA